MEKAGHNKVKPGKRNLSTHEVAQFFAVPNTNSDPSLQKQKQTDSGVTVGVGLNLLRINRSLFSYTHFNRWVVTPPPPHSEGFGKVMFLHLSVCPQERGTLAEWPGPAWKRESLDRTSGYPPDRMGYTPTPTGPGDSRYAAGSIPQEFTEEDFLVDKIILPTLFPVS